MKLNYGYSDELKVSYSGAKPRADCCFLNQPQSVVSYGSAVCSVTLFIGSVVRFATLLF